MSYLLRLPSADGCDTTKHQIDVKEDVQDKVKTNLASMCGGTITDIAVHHSCGSGNSELITIAIAQDFGSSGNVLKIEMPCIN